MRTYQSKEKASSPASAEATQFAKKAHTTPDVIHIPVWTHMLPYPPFLASDRLAILQNNPSTQKDISSFSNRAAHSGHDFSQVPIHSPQPATLQTKLQVNQPGDVYEREADQVADQVMRMPDKESLASDEKNETETSLICKQSSQMGNYAGTDIHNIPPIVHDVLNGGGGQLLDVSTRAFMEPRFGYDFSQVHIHTDQRAAESAQSVNALAYTVGQDIVFNSGQYASDSHAGRRLLAHELAHVVQQRQGLPLRTEGEPERSGSPASVRLARQGYVANNSTRYTGSFGTEKGEKLPEYKGNIGRFTEKELNDAMKTVFGEISSTPHKDLDKEAKAVASTIFNRLLGIEAARKAYTSAVIKVSEANLRRGEAGREYDELAKKPSKYTKELGKYIYEQRLKDIKQEFDEATKALGKSQKEAVNAKTALDRVEKQTIKPNKMGKPITLSDIVVQDSQYEGTKKGKKDFANFSSMSKTDQQRNKIRYEVAKKAVIDLANDPTKAYKFTEFKGGNLRLHGALPGETKIGGNFFK